MLDIIEELYRAAPLLISSDSHFGEGGSGVGFCYKSERINFPHSGSTMYNSPNLTNISRKNLANNLLPHQADRGEIKSTGTLFFCRPEKNYSGN